MPQWAVVLRDDTWSCPKSQFCPLVAPFSDGSGSQGLLERKKNPGLPDFDLYSPTSISSEGTEEPVKVREAGDGVFECEYYPVVPGKYVVTITWGGYAIPRR